MSTPFTPGPATGQSDDYRPDKFALSNSEVRATGILCQGAVLNISRELLELRALCASHAQHIERLRLINAEMYEALKAYSELDDKHANCEECDGELQPELCAECFPYADAARLKMRAALAKAVQEDQETSR